MPARSSPPSTFQRRQPPNSPPSIAVETTASSCWSGHGAEQLITDMWRMTEAFFAQDETVKGPVRRTVDNPFGYWDREAHQAQARSQRSLRLRRPVRTDGSPQPLACGARRVPNNAHRVLRHVLATRTDTLGVIRDAGPRRRTLRRGTRLRMSARPRPFVSTTTPSAIRCRPNSGGLPNSDRPPSATTPIRVCSPCCCRTTPADSRQNPPPTDGSTCHPDRRHRRQPRRHHAGLTNDQYKAAVHRVVPMTERSRYSIPYFSNPPRTRSSSRSPP